MDDIFQLSVPWWHFVLRAVLVYVGLLVLIRLSGKRTVGEFTPFDLIVVILLGETMQGALTADDTSITGALLLAVTLVVLNYVVGALSTRSRTIDRLTEGDSVTLLRNGKVLGDALKKHNVPKSDLEEAAREHGVASLGKVALATLEANGHITIVPKRRTKAA
jgi:uncharacterized membrane protein YcaP (DUF421 family)